MGGVSTCNFVHIYISTLGRASGVSWEYEERALICAFWRWDIGWSLARFISIRGCAVRGNIGISAILSWIEVG